MKLLIPEHPLMVLPSLAKEIGLNEAIALQQLHYWTTKKEPDETGQVWVYNTLKEWRQEFPWMAPATIKRVMARLRDKGLIEIHQEGTDRTNHYRLIYENVPAKLIPSSDQIDPLSNTTETSTERTGSSSSISTTPTSTEVQSVWENHKRLFPSTRGRLSPSRVRTIEKALKEFPAEDLCKASLGLKRWREQKEGSTALSAVFATYPGGRPLADHIAFFIEQGEKAAPADDDLDVDQVRREQGLE